ncbi:hypothetical protein GHT06_008939 [Daphnia sinensis]|uniref:Uncharacterized protein n=1 Tax=Daphnia sinensis TaxID=1820382 RepID=A0AAD5LMU8_9CRUS|nr:hypothetical protein GHT06_008939 [Daphnia sinensis]
MLPKQRPYAFEKHQKMTYLLKIRRLGEFHAQVKFGERPHPLHPTPTREYQPLPPGVHIDEKLAFYETSFYKIASRYLPRKEAVAVTNMQVNADYDRYLESQKPPSQRKPVVVEEREPIYPNIKLPSGPLKNPMPPPSPRPSSPGPSSAPSSPSPPASPRPSSSRPAPPSSSLVRYREIPPSQVRPVSIVVVSSIFATKAGVSQEEKKKVKVAIEDREGGQVVKVKKEEEDEVVLKVLEPEF